MNGMFYHCTELEYVDLSNFTFSNTKDVSKMFYSCPKLIQIIFPVNAQSNNIEDFSDMFSFSTELKTVNLSSFSFQKAKNMGYMFNGCTKIENIIFSGRLNIEKEPTYEGQGSSDLKENVINCIYTPNNYENNEIDLLHDYSFNEKMLEDFKEEEKKSYEEAKELNQKLFKEKEK